MTPLERRAVFSLSGIYALRFFGLFMLLPIMALYAVELKGSTPFLVGLALGGYGLTQALLQVPFGYLSDRFERKRVISAGLLVLAVGSLIAAYADSIYGLIFGRCVQGAGAISAAVLALTADLTRGSQRTKAMAIIGVSIGATFMLSLVLAPLLEQLISTEGLFLLVAGLAVIAIGVLEWVVPDPGKRREDTAPHSIRAEVAAVLADRQLLRLDLGIFTLHFVLTALFVVTPILLVTQGQIGPAAHWKVYFWVLLASVAGMVPLVALAGRGGRLFLAYRLATGLLVVGCLVLAVAVDGGLWPLLVALVLFFIAFNALEAMLPSLVSRVVRARARGTATSVYNTFQFGGIFLGGSLGGAIHGLAGAAGVFWLCFAVATGWLLLVLRSGAFVFCAERTVDLGDLGHSRIGDVVDRIEALKGVESVTTVRGETVLHLEVVEEHYDPAEVQRILETAGGQSHG